MFLPQSLYSYSICEQCNFLSNEIKRRPFIIQLIDCGACANLVILNSAAGTGDGFTVGVYAVVETFSVLNIVIL